MLPFSGTGPLNFADICKLELLISSFTLCVFGWLGSTETCVTFALTVLPIGKVDSIGLEAIGLFASNDFICAIAVASIDLASALI